ncbi:MAG: hypothetical protein H3C27_16595 [Opitutaceae bacterium]|nr:hypothetical protein [Opitutaceae bacterium]
MKPNLPFPLRKPSFRDLGATFAGLFTAVVLIALVQAVAHQLYPPPPGTDFNDPAALAELMAQMPVGALLMVLLSYAIGTLMGALVASRFSAAHLPARQGWIVGLMMLTAGVMNLLAIPHPAWFWVACFGVFAAAAWVGTRAGCALRPAV